MLELVKALPGRFCSGQMQMGLQTGLQTVRICGDPKVGDPTFYFKGVSV